MYLVWDSALERKREDSTQSLLSRSSLLSRKGQYENGLSQELKKKNATREAQRGYDVSPLWEFPE
jgi:hypothetical protein